MKNTQSGIKPIKTGKDLGTTSCLGCKDYTHNFKPQEIKMTNKVLREKSNCVVCRSSKSTKTQQQRKIQQQRKSPDFVKEYRPNKKQK